MDVQLTDPASGRAARVDRFRMLEVSVMPGEPQPPGEPSRLRFMRHRLGSTGADSGTTNQRVNGSVTAQEFYVQAHNDYDIMISAIIVLIADASADHNSFGAVASLTNGWTLRVIEAGEGTEIINAAKTGGEVILQTGFTFGDGALAGEIVNWRTNEDATLVQLPIAEWVPGGVRLARGSEDRIVSLVQDNLEGLTEFTVDIVGYRWYP